MCFGKEKLFSLADKGLYCGKFLVMECGIIAMAAAGLAGAALMWFIDDPLDFPTNFLFGASQRKKPKFS